MKAVERHYFAAALFAMLVCGRVSAHDLGGMSTRVTVTSQTVTATFRLTARDAVALAPGADLNADGKLTSQESRLARRDLGDGIAARFGLVIGGVAIAPDAATLHVEAPVMEPGGTAFAGDIHEIAVTSSWRLPAMATKSGDTVTTSFTIDPNLFRAALRDIVPGTAASETAALTRPPDGGQSNAVTIIVDQSPDKPIFFPTNGEDVYESEITFTGGEIRIATSANSMTATATSAQSVSGGATSHRGPARTSTIHMLRFYLWEGILHILTGFDHLCFVAGLALGAKRLRELVKVITAFTVAHSVTLALTATDVFHISHPQWVEAAIAISIAFIGIENLVNLKCDRPEAKRRWIIAFAFGLIHGMGFAGAFREDLGADLPHAGALIALALLAFNVGVEVGQLGVLAVGWPALRATDRRSPRAWRWTVVVVSSLVAFMGISWAVNRTILPDGVPWARW